MGIGTFDDGLFHLYVDIQKDDSAESAKAWEACFRAADRLLYYATDGCMQFGTLTYEVDVPEDRRGEVDIAIRPPDQSDWANDAKVGGMGKRSTKDCLTLTEKARKYPYIVVHELGHYAFALDQHLPTEPLQETNAYQHGICIMAYGEDHGDYIDHTGHVAGEVRRFCSPWLTPNWNEQHPANHEDSCLQKIMRRIDALRKREFQEMEWVPWTHTKTVRPTKAPATRAPKTEERKKKAPRRS